MTALYYSAGTVSLTAGSAVVTGIDTAWQTALIVGGEIYVQAAGNPLPIASVDSDTKITSALVWRGATGTYPYVLRVGTAYDEQIAKNAEILARLLSEIEAGTFWKYDASGDTVGRAVYDARPKGFGYLDISGSQPVFWIKASDTAGDWSGPFSYGVGPIGPMGPKGMNWRGAWSGTTAYLKDDAVSYNNASWIALVDNTNVTPVAGATWGLVAARGATGAAGTSFTYRGAYSAGTAYAVRDVATYNSSSWIATAATTGNAPPTLPTESNAFWSLLAAKGLDGTGTGDVVGPSSAPMEGSIAVFSSTTGKALRALGTTLPVVSNLNTHDDTGFFRISGGATGQPTEPGTIYDAVGWMVSYSGQRDQFLSASASELFWRVDDGTVPGGAWSAWKRIDGNVNGPASAADGQIAAFSGATGRLLKAISIGTTAGTIAAGDDPRFSAGGRNEAILALEIADLKGSQLGMIGGVADAFDDETGVDTAASVNAAYDAANDWYMPVAPAAQTDGNGSSTTGASLFTLISRVFALRNGEKMMSIGVQTNAANDVTVKIVQRNSATNYTVLQSHTFAHPGGGWFDFVLPVPFDVPASGTFHVGAVQIQGQTILTRSAARTYLAGDAPVGAATSGWTEDSSGARPMRAAYLPANMTLKSVSYTAQVAPTKGRLSLQIASGAPTVNVDLLAEISRNGGASWTAASLVLASSFSGLDVFEAQNIDISAQPSGTAMQWRVRTQNNKPIAVSGVVMQWS